MHPPGGVFGCVRLVVCASGRLHMHMCAPRTCSGCCTPAMLVRTVYTHTPFIPPVVICRHFITSLLSHHSSVCLQQHAHCTLSFYSRSSSRTRRRSTTRCVLCEATSPDCCCCCSVIGFVGFCGLSPETLCPLSDHTYTPQLWLWERLFGWSCCYLPTNCLACTHVAWSSDFLHVLVSLDT